MQYNFRGLKVLFKLLIFEFKCIYYDIRNLKVNRRKLRELNGEKYNIFVCSLWFFYEKKWQVVSQAELWHRFASQSNVILCGSIVSYLLYGKNAENVVSLEPKYNSPNITFNNIHTKSVIFVSDAHSKKWLNNYVNSHNITDILTPYKKTLLSTSFANNIESDHIHSFPWCVNDHIVFQGDIDIKRNDVLGFGKTGSEVYDLREWAFDSGELVAFNYAGSGNQKFSGDAFYHWLRTFDACVVGMSTIPLYNYTVAKFFEVPSQALLLFAFPTEDIIELGFEDNVNCIFVTKENFKTKLECFKNDPSSFISLRKAGVKFIKENHTVSARLETLNNLLVNEDLSKGAS